MIYLIPDTNQWIYLANSKDPTTEKLQAGHHFVLLQKLAELIAKGEIRILINDIIEKEWLKNRNHAEELIRSLTHRKGEEIARQKRLVKDLGDHVKEATDNICKEIEKKYDADIAKNTQHIQNVEALLAASEKFAISKDIKADVVDWGIEKKAPFTGDKKNSIADACILLGAIDHIAQKGKRDFWGTWYPKAYFVSGNINDFADPANQSEIHPDLKPLLDRVSMRYYRSLPFALRAVDQHVLDEELVRLMEAEMEWQANNNTAECLVCDPAEENEGLNNVHFGEPYQLRNDLQDVNPNQIAIPFEYLEPADVKKTDIQTACCEWCGAWHLKCSCGEIVSLDDFDDGDIMECENCRTRYQINREYMGSGQIQSFLTYPRTA